MIEYEGIKLHWLGHDGFKVIVSEQFTSQLGKPKSVTNKKVIYIDPYKLSKKFHDLKDADVILLSHDHFDHLSLNDLSQIVNEDCHIACANECIEKLGGLAVAGIKGLEPGEKTIISGIEIEAVNAYNTNKDFHPKKDNKIGFVITINKKRIYHAGDTDLIPEMSEIQPDIALVPVSGTYVMTADEAARAVNEFLKPKKLAIPMHYGSIIGSQKDAESFRDRVKVCKVEILQPESA